MKINRIRIYKIILLTVFYTAYVCSRSIYRYFRGTTNRAWVDRVIQKWADKVLQLAAVDCTVVNPYGIQPEQGTSTIVMCNHSSLYDIPISFKAFPNNSLRMLSKKELASIPLMGKGMEWAEFPFIDRKNRQQAVKDLEKVKNLLKSGIIMWIAPEGTRSRDGKLAAFKKGVFLMAIEAKATIIPMGIRGAYNILPAKKTSLNTNQAVEIHIGKPINTANYTVNNKDELIQLVHTAIANLI